MSNTIQVKGKTLFLTVLDGVTYGYMTGRAQREFFARKAV